MKHNHNNHAQVKAGDLLLDPTTSILYVALRLSKTFWKNRALRDGQKAGLYAVTAPHENMNLADPHTYTLMYDGSLLNLKKVGENFRFYKWIPEDFEYDFLSIHSPTFKAEEVEIKEEVDIEIEEPDGSVDEIEIEEDIIEDEIMRA